MKKAVFGADNAQVFTYFLISTAEDLNSTQKITLLLDDEDMPSEIKAQFLSNILSDSERLGRLIHNILDFEKLSTGREQINKTK